MLATLLEPYLGRFHHYFGLLREINAGIWEIQDRFHGKDVSPEAGAEMCRQILEENDRRFRVKATINEVSDSPLREQKGYKGKIAMLYARPGLDLRAVLNGAIRYLATSFDTVLVACRPDEIESLRPVYADLSGVELFPIDSAVGSDPTFPDEWRSAAGLRDEAKLFTCGFGFEGKEEEMNPDALYDELCLPPEIRDSYFYDFGAP